jgi:hypothetical protein
MSTHAAGRSESAFLQQISGTTPAAERAVSRDLPMGRPEITNMTNLVGTGEGQLASLIYAASLRREPEMAAKAAGPAANAEAQVAASTAGTQAKAAPKEYAGMIKSPTPFG